MEKHLLQPGCISPYLVPAPQFFLGNQPFYMLIPSLNRISGAHHHAVDMVLTAKVPVVSKTDKIKIPTFGQLTS